MSLDFKDEAEFRVKWVAPFLNKLGYILVNHIHGTSEQGRDFFFADFDRFEHRRFYAAQVKIGSIGAGKAELDSLLNQVSRSFTVKLRFHKEADEKHVSAVYIMASGSISREAREYISDWCKRQHFGENVYYLDGDTLERLEKYAFQRIDSDLRNQFIGILNECQYNERVVASIYGSFQQRQTIFGRCRHFALDSALASPPPNDVLQFETLQKAWHHLTTLNKLCDYHLLPMTTTDQQWAERVQFAAKTQEFVARLRNSAQEAITILDKRYAITVEVLE
jgi:hypothetical protein